MFRSPAMGGIGHWDKESFWRENAYKWFLSPRVLPNRTPSPPGSDPKPPQTVAGVFFGEVYKTRTTSRIDGRLNLVGHTEELAKQHTLNTLDPYVLDDNAVFLLEVDA